MKLVVCQQSVNNRHGCHLSSRRDAVSRSIVSSPGGHQQLSDIGQLGGLMDALTCFRHPVSISRWVYDWWEGDFWQLYAVGPQIDAHCQGERQKWFLMNPRNLFRRGSDSLSRVPKSSGKCLPLKTISGSFNFIDKNEARPSSSHWRTRRRGCQLMQLYP